VVTWRLTNKAEWRRVFCDVQLKLIVMWFILEINMKIEFEFDCSYKGKLTIDGVVMSVDMRPGETRLNGITQTEMENTLGGIVAESLFGQLADVMQAWATAAEECDTADTWCALPDEVAYDVANRLA